MKESDKAIVVFGVVILIVASMGIAVWAPEKEEDSDLVVDDSLNEEYKNNQIPDTNESDIPEEPEEIEIIKPMLYNMIAKKIERLEKRIESLNKSLEKCYKVILID